MPEIAGAAMLLLCITAPMLFHICSDGSAHGAPTGESDSIALVQARIDSAQHRADSIDSARAAARARRKAIRDSARALRAFRPTPRDRLADPVSP